MEIPITPQQTPENNIKEQFNQGPQGQRAPSAEEIAKYKEDREKFMDEQLPYMRKEEEFAKLQLSILELDVMMGRVPIKQVPGLMGEELMVRHLQAEGYLQQWATGQQDAIKRAKMEKEMAEAEQKAKEDWAKLTEEAQTTLRAEMEKEIEENNMLPGYNALSEDQKINIIMQKKAMKG